MFKQKVKVINPKDPTLFFEEDFWVDTGATYSFIPEDYLERIKAEPLSKRTIIYANGRTEIRLFGEFSFELTGWSEKITCPVIFAPKNSLFLLGATALENFSVAADPVDKKLKPVLGIIGGFIATRY